MVSKKIISKKTLKYHIVNIVDWRRIKMEES